MVEDRGLGLERLDDKAAAEATRRRVVAHVYWLWKAWGPPALVQLYRCVFWRPWSACL